MAGLTLWLPSRRCPDNDMHGDDCVSLDFAHGRPKICSHKITSVCIRESRHQACRDAPFNSKLPGFSRQGEAYAVVQEAHQGLACLFLLHGHKMLTPSIWGIKA